MGNIYGTRTIKGEKLLPDTPPPAFLFPTQ